MKTLIILGLIVSICTGCTALPAEERAFAVVLCVEKRDVWQVCARIPTYQSGGGYVTVTGKGGTLEDALAGMDAASPMRINLSQLRLIAVDAVTARAGDLQTVLSCLSGREDIRMQCTVALTDAPLKEVAEAMKPAAGTRLSKALELMIDARIGQGLVLPCTLAEVLCMGDRQSPVMAALSLEGKNINLAGGYTVDGVLIAPDETVLLSLLLGSTKEAQLALAQGCAEVRRISANTVLSEDLAWAGVELTLTANASTLTDAELERALADVIVSLLSRLSAAGCDVLGLGRQAVTGSEDTEAWRALNWPEKYSMIHWQVAVGVRGQA